MVNVALIGFLVGLVVGIVALIYDIHTELDWEYRDAIVPIVVFPLLSSSAFVMGLFVVRWTLLR